MIPMRYKIKNYVNDKKGSIAVMGAVALFSLVTITGAAIDTATYMNVKSSFKNAIDNALTSAIPVVKSQNIDEVALKFFNANFPPKYRQNINDVDINIVENEKTMSWDITASTKIKTTFANLIGSDGFEIKHTAKVSWDISKQVEAVFTLDTSASMCMVINRKTNNTTGGTIINYTPDNDCEKLNSLKKSMAYMIDEGFSSIKGLNSQPVFSVGIIPFNHKVKFPGSETNPATPIPNPLSEIETTSAFGSPDYYTNFIDANPLSELTPLRAIQSDSDKTYLKDSVSDIIQTPLGNGWTRSNIAVLTAALMLDPDYHSYFKGVKPKDFNDKNVDKILIMMTDGANIGCCFAAHPEGNFDNQYLYLYEVDNTHLSGVHDMSYYNKWNQKYNISKEGLCSQLKKAGVTIYSVIFDVEDNDPGGKEIKDVYRDCASNETTFFDVHTNDELEDAYKKIAQSFFRIRITY